MVKPIVIGIAGGTGSGKTTLVKRLQKELGDQVTTICHDSYYKSYDELTLEERHQMNYDHPNAFDTHLMTEQVIALKQNASVELPVYDYVGYTRTEETIQVLPKRVIIVEGILIFENKELRDQLDIKVFVDTDADVRIIRRIIRDVKKRGRTLESVIEQYLSTVKVMHEDFVEPSKRHADIIIPEGGRNDVAVSMLVDKIKVLLSEKGKL